MAKYLVETLIHLNVDVPVETDRGPAEAARIARETAEAIFPNAALVDLTDVKDIGGTTLPFPPLPLRIPCEGSGLLAHQTSLNGGTCQVCGVRVTCRDDGRTYPHDRNDVLTMLERDDFR